MKKICCLILVCLTLVQLSACGDSGKSETVKVFEEVCEQMDQVKDLTLSDAKKEKVNKKLRENLGELGLTYYGDATLYLNQSFIDNYLVEHTKEELLSNSLKLYEYVERTYDSSQSMSASSWHNDWSHCACETLTDLMELVFKATGITGTSYTAYKNSTSGYYVDNPNANPQPFYNKLEDGHEEYGEVTYYGDFATFHKKLDRYNDGFLGWRNGIFYDIPSSWETLHVYELYYKGKCLVQEEFPSAINYLKIVELDGKIYTLTYKTQTVNYTTDESHRYLSLDRLY